MGERLSDGAQPGRRHAHPAVPGPDAAVEALLAEALRAAPDSDGERRAVAAFRAARDAGEHRARTRRGDDWSPRTRRHTARSLKATLSVLVASLALGGVAFAAIGSAGDDAGGSHSNPQQSASASDGRSAPPSVSPSPDASDDRDRPANAQDTEAHCRAYEKVEGRGRAMDSTAWQRLLAEAGGEENVAAYCAARTASATPGNGNGDGGGNGNAGGTEKAGKTPKAEGTARAEGTAKAEASAKAENSARGKAHNG
jgi:hypothetical protein